MRTLLMLATLAMPFGASAGLIVDNPAITGPDILNAADFGVGVSSCSAGPATAIDGGFSVSSDGAACFAFKSGWGFAGNGQWDPPFGELGDASGKTTITIALGGLYSDVWSFIDWNLTCDDEFTCNYNADGTSNDPVIAALDKNKNVIESFDIGQYNFGSTNEFDFAAGRIFEISESTADIAYFQIGGDNIAAHDLQVSGNLPEPSAAALLGLGLALLILARRHAIIKDCPRSPHPR